MAHPYEKGTSYTSFYSRLVEATVEVGYETYYGYPDAADSVEICEVWIGDVNIAELLSEEAAVQLSLELERDLTADHREAA